MYAVLLGPLAVALLEPTVPQQRRSLFVAQHRPAVRRLDVPLLLAHGMDHGRGHVECRIGEVEEGHDGIVGASDWARSFSNRFSSSSVRCELPCRSTSRWPKTARDRKSVG